MNERGARERFLSIRARRRVSGSLDDGPGQSSAGPQAFAQPDPLTPGSLEPPISRLLALEEVSDRRMQRAHRRKVDALVRRFGAISFTLVVLAFICSMTVVLTDSHLNRVAGATAAITLALLVGICRRIVKAATPEAEDAPPGALRSLLSVLRRDEL